MSTASGEAVASIEDLYNKMFGTRERWFYADDNQVMAGDEGGGFVVCEIEYADPEIAVLIAELLNEARDRARRRNIK